MANAKRAKRTLRASNRNLFSEAGNYLPPLPGSEMPSLTKAERLEVSRSRANDLSADTQAALDRPSKPTPRQLQARAKSEAIKATRKTRKPL